MLEFIQRSSTVNAPLLKKKKKSTITSLLLTDRDNFSLAADG